MRRLHRAVVAWASLLVGASLLVVGGCGYKNHPVPPATVVPKAIEDLRYETSEKGVTLTWTYPQETIRGNDIEAISAFDLYRAEIPLQDYCGSCPIPFAEPLEQPAGLTTEDGKPRKTTFTMPGLKPGYKYFFKVRSRTSWFAESDDSNIVTFIWQVPARAPGQVTAKVGNREIVLNWQPVTALRDGGPLRDPLQYQILRSTGGRDFEKIGVTKATSFVDHQVAVKQQYTYQVQSQLLVGKEVVPGGMSQPVSTLAADRTAPAAPIGVSVIETGVGIKVLWEKAEAEDLGGYRIYRRAAAAKEMTLVGEVEPVYTLFVDTKAKPGVRYYYSVTAIDQSTPANESAKSAEATTRE